MIESKKEWDRTSRLRDREMRTSRSTAGGCLGLCRVCQCDLVGGLCCVFRAIRAFGSCDRVYARSQKCGHYPASALGPNDDRGKARWKKQASTPFGGRAGPFLPGEREWERKSDGAFKTNHHRRRCITGNAPDRYSDPNTSCLSSSSLSRFLGIVQVS